MTESTNEIISLCIKGNKEAFRRLVEMYQPYAYALSLRLLCHEIEKCRRCRKEMISIKDSDQLISQLRKITPRIPESETVTNLILNSIDQTRVSKTKAFDKSTDKLVSFLVTPRVRIGFVIILILLAGSYLTQETMIENRSERGNRS